MSDVSTQATGNTQATGSAQPGAEGAATSGTTAAPAAAPAAAAPAAPQSQQAIDGQPAGGKPADGTQGQSGTQDGTKPTGAPEKYEFKAPQGVLLDDTVVAKFSTVAKELNLSQDAAQKVLNELGPELAQANAKAIADAMGKQSTAWQEQVKADKDIGGEKLNENLAVARKAVERFAPPELRALLNPYHAKDNPNGTGLGNHPAVVKLFHAIGKAISEDRFVPGTTKPAAGGRDAASVLYGSSTQA